MGRAKKEYLRKAMGGWIKNAIKKPGSLHRALHVPSGEKIPPVKLAQAAHSRNPLLRRRASLAQTLKTFASHRRKP